MAITT